MYAETEVVYGDTKPATYSPSSGYKALTQAQYEEYLKSAIAVSNEGVPKPPGSKDVVCLTTKETIVVPKEESTKVDVTREVMCPKMTKKTVKGHRLVPRQTWKAYDEKCIEVKEEVQKCTRTVWKPVEETYYEIVKKPVETCKTSWRPVTEYCQEEVDIDVEVPCDELQKQDGYRYDKKLTSQVVEVEKQEYYKFVPTKCDGPEKMSYKVIGDGNSFGVVEVGKEVFPEYDCNVCESPTAVYAPPKDLTYKHLDAASFASSSQRGTPGSSYGYGNGAWKNGMPPQRPPTTMSQMGGLPGTSSGRIAPVASNQARNRPPTGAYYQAADGRVMVQQSSGSGRVHESIQGLLTPSLPRLTTPQVKSHAPASRGAVPTRTRGPPPAPQRGSQRLVIQEE